MSLEAHKVVFHTEVWLPSLTSDGGYISPEGKELESTKKVRSATQTHSSHTRLNTRAVTHLHTRAHTRVRDPSCACRPYPLLTCLPPPDFTC